MKIKSLLLLSLLALFVSCNKNPELDIEVIGLDSGDITIIYAKPNEVSNQNTNVIYASKFEKGKHNITFDSIRFEKYLMECALIIRNEEKSIFINIPLPLENGKKIKIKISNLEDFEKGGIVKTSYEGTKHAEDFNKFWDKIQTLKIDEVNADNTNIKNIYSKFVDVYKEYISKYPESGFPFMLMMSQVSSIQYDASNPIFEYSNTICVDINKNDWKEIYCRLIGEKILALETSSKLVFKALDINGKKFTELDTKGSLILVDFWASWCKPCKEEIPELITLYNKYKDKGFNIIGISIDNNENDWKNYLRSNPLPWLSLLGEGKIITKRYDFEYIPYNLLVDSEGNVIGKNLHGKELSQFVDRYYNK